MIKQDLIVAIQETLTELSSRGDLPADCFPPLQLDVPKREGQGDYASAAALTLAQGTARRPRDVAEVIVQGLRPRIPFVDKIDIAGPGFINFTIKPSRWLEVLNEIVVQGEVFGRSDPGAGRRVQIEFVSANPTGPLHVGHGRWAAVGNAMANLLVATGYQVEREYYNNDAGRQVKLLGRSIYARYQRLAGVETPDPEGGYRGEYVTELAQHILEQEGRRFVGVPVERCLDELTQLGVSAMLREIRSDLEAFRIRFDRWFSEASLFSGGEVKAALERLRQGGFLFEADGATWFRSTAFGDDKDRVVIKEDGEHTYLASDIAYHWDKLRRGYDLVIDIWGADHHGYVARMEAVVQALGYPLDRIKIKIGQLVTLMRAGQPVAMSKRAGNFVTLREVVVEVGADAALFFFLTRRLDSPLEFDLELAKQQSNDNPVYYVQYAHARIASLFRQVVERGVATDPVGASELARLALPEELVLIKKLAQFPDLVEASASALEPHRISFYLLELAALLHNYYFQHRFISDDLELTRARLRLARAVQIVVANGLGLMGVTAPERM